MLRPARPLLAGNLSHLRKYHAIIKREYTSSHQKDRTSPVGTGNTRCLISIESEPLWGAKEPPEEVKLIHGSWGDEFVVVEKPAGMF
jgi:hypothetical protein